MAKTNAKQKTFGLDAFKKLAVKNEKTLVFRKLPEFKVEEPEIPAGPSSEFSQILEAHDPNAFVIQPPDKRSKLYLETKIYFWETA